MKLDIRGLGLRPTHVLKRYIERRLRHALRSFDIERITVRLIRDHGHGRHATRRCQVAVSSRGLEPLLVNEVHGSLRVACSRAVAKTKRTLTRAVHRTCDLHRTEPGTFHDFDVPKGAVS